MNALRRSLCRALPCCLFTAVAITPSCAQTSGIEAKPCRPGCVDSVTRLECDANGRPRAIPCPESDQACAAPVCRQGSCGYRPATGAPCGADGSAQCNAGYACLGPLLKLTAIRQHTCAVADDGMVWCWGNNDRGELGDGTAESRGNPTPVRGLPGRAIDASAGYAHTCALLEDGSAYCWGDNTGGQIDSGSIEERIFEPTRSPSTVPFVTISAGQAHTCATTAEGEVYCWGNTSGGQCGVDPKDAFAVGPTKIPGLDRVTKLVTVKNHICAVRTSDPTLVCWGSNQYIENGGDIIGKLGPSAAKLDYSAVPIPVDLGARVVDVGMGFESTYATTENGLTYAWGYNGRGQLGLDTTEDSVLSPTPVLTAPGTPLRGARELGRSDGSDLCAEMSDTSLGSKYVCWGGDDYGELGFGVARMSSRYARATTVLPLSAGNLVRGENHACFQATDESGVDVWCYGIGNLVGNGTASPDVTQALPARVSWDPASFEAFAFTNTAK
jgi:hypothetical protein